MRHEMSNSYQDVRHRFEANGSYELPVGQGGLVMNNNKLASRLIGNWKANAIISLQTGEPSMLRPRTSVIPAATLLSTQLRRQPLAGASKSPGAFVGSTQRASSSTPRRSRHRPLALMAHAVRDHGTGPGWKMRTSASSSSSRLQKEAG